MSLKCLFSGMMLSNRYNIMSTVLWFLNVKFRGNGHLNNAVCCARSSLTAPMTSNTFYSFCCHRQSYFHRSLARWHHQQQQQQRATWLPYCWPSADEPASETVILYSLLHGQDFRQRSTPDPSRSMSARLISDGHIPWPELSPIIIIVDCTLSAFITVGLH